MTQFFSLILLLALGLSCNKLDPNETSIEFEIPSLVKTNSLVSEQFLTSDTPAPYAPADVSGFDCVLVNVVGQGIGEWDANRERVGVGRNFSYVGTVSKMVSAKKGGVVELKIKKGSLRYIQLIGVRSNIGCPSDVSASDLNSFTKFPGMFIIGSVQKDIFKSETITIKSSYSVTSAADFRASEDQPFPDVDKDAPTPGSSGAIQVTAGADSATVSWAAASDKGTLPDYLKYKLVTSSVSEDIDSVSEVNALSGDGVLVDWGAGTTSNTVSILDPSATYYFSVVVKDSSGNMAIYQVGTYAPSCICPAGSYLGATGCVTAEIGYWANACVRTACSNAPDNSSYSSTGSSSANCSWTCNTGYAPNADYSSCVSLGDATNIGCTGTEVIVGFNIRHDDIVYQLGAICQNYNAGKPTGAYREGTSVGGDGGSAEEFKCPKDEVIQAIEYKNSTVSAGSIRFFCRNSATNVESGWSKWFGSYTGDSSSITCDAGKYFNWLAITNQETYVGPIKNQFLCI